MAGNFEGIKTRNFGIEIEMTGLTRCQAAKAIAKVLGGTPNHEGGTYDKYTVRDEKGRDWSIVYDGSIKCVDANGNNASKSYSVELNSPVLGYEDIPLAVRSHGCFLDHQPPELFIELVNHHVSFFKF